MNTQLRKIINILLIPHFSNERTRRTICDNAFSDHPNLLGRIDYNGAPLDFASHLISVLDTYGKLKSGKPAIVELLLVVRDMVGGEKQEKIDEIISHIGPDNAKQQSGSVGSKVRILVLSANPKDSMRLRIVEEVREISEGLKRSKFRDRFELASKWAVRPSDLRRSLLDIEPTIIHLSGHGVGGEKSGIYLEDKDGVSQLVQTTDLANLIGILSDSVQCVVLNSCYSEHQAKAIVEHIPYVIGMNDAIEDETAILFSTAFYDGLGAGLQIEKSFQLAVNAVELEGARGEQIPMLLTNAGGVKTVKKEPENPTPPVSRDIDSVIAADKETANSGDQSIVIIASPSDDAAARELYREIKNRGHVPWYEPIDLLPGLPVQQTIRKAIRDSDCSIVLFSKQALETRGQIHRNYRSALDALQERPEGEIFLIPVILDDCEIPFDFQSYSFVDFRNKEEAIRKIWGALGAG